MFKPWQRQSPLYHHLFQILQLPDTNLRFNTKEPFCEYCVIIFYGRTHEVSPNVDKHD